MKKVLISVVSTLLVLLFFVQMGWLEIIGINRISFSQQDEDKKSTVDAYSYETVDGISYRVKAKDDSFYIFTDGKWQKTFMAGVNIGAGEPGIFPGELTISYDTYFKWFEQISAMNANCIRVYTAMRPQFYDALRDFNEKSENPLFLFQGVWMNEEDIQSLSDVYAENQKIYQSFTADALALVDIIHGKGTLPERAGYASGTYTSDVSKWFGGWILGIEWEPNLVINTNTNNADKSSFDGAYLYTQGASPFEAFLASVGNEVIKYETETYKFQAPLAFANWITTDPITHPGEPHQDEDKISVNMENIKTREALKANMFLSYHIYPYYPDSLNYQRDYLDYVDETGKVNTYRAYLQDLKLAHTLPIMVAEFGIPTSRGMGHESVMAYNQGYVDEIDQGTMIIDMFNSIYKENYAGGIVFTWQDEWFKRTWNNVNFDIPDRRPFWSNIQTTEQCFGLLSFDPGETQSTCIIDGDDSDWKGTKAVSSGENGELYVKSDARYIYLCVKPKNYNFDKDTLVIPLDVIDGQGNNFYEGKNLNFDAYADFVILISGKNESRIVVDSYYDAFYYLYGEQYKMLAPIENIRTKNTGRFHQMMMCYGYEMKIPTTGETIPFKSFETGKLRFGNSNPESTEYQSLTDFNYTDGTIEIRIPWQLLNVMDPSEKKIMDDFYAQQVITPTDYAQFKMGFGILKNNEDTPVTISLSGSYTYDNWTIPKYHQRLKPAYYELQKHLKKYSGTAKKK